MESDDLQKQYITIWGICASIVLAFTGEIAFSTSVLENIGNASICRIFSITILLAFVMLNVIYILTRFVMEICGINIGCKKGYPRYMLALNAVCGCLLAGMIICWIIDVPRIIILFQQWLY